MNLNNLRIRTKLLIAFVVIAMITGAVGIVGEVNLTKLADSDRDMYETNVGPMGFVIGIANNSQKIQVIIRDALIAGQGESAKESARKIAELQQNIEKDMGKLEKAVGQAGS